jgi:hypothetical protein
MGACRHCLRVSHVEKRAIARSCIYLVSKLAYQFFNCGVASNGWDDVFLDVDLSDGLAPGEHWQNALKAAADRCEAVLFLISPNRLSSAWCLSEFLLAKQLCKRLFPLLIDGASLGGLPLEISSDHQAVDLVGDPFGWDRLREGLRRAGLDAHSFPFPKGRRPYPGFEPLTEEDAAIFFGREAQVIRGRP